jgi:hypothetical protein
VIATRPLVDTLEEQELLERMLDESKPPLPDGLAHLHFLLFTPFRYPSTAPRGSRFRTPTDPGVFYAADEVRTACAELGYWRWRMLSESPTLETFEARQQTVFRVAVEASTVDLRLAPFVRDAGHWVDAAEYAACQAFADAARQAGVEAIRYGSVRDPQGGGCVALLTPQGFAAARPLESQGWWLTVTRERVVWRRADPLFPEDRWEFAVRDLSR